MEREFHQINDPAGPFDDGRELEPIEDAIGQDLLQAYLEAAYSVYLTRCYVPTFPSPLLTRPKPLDCSFDELEAT